MDSKQINSVRTSAIFQATQKGYSQEWAEDFAQDACERVFKGRKGSVSQLLVDYIRATQGSTRQETDRTVRFELFEQSIDEQRIAVPARSMTEPDLLKYLNLLSGEERVIVALKFVWDMTEPEIGFVLGVSYSRISQRLKDIRARLLKRLQKMDPAEPLTMT